MKFLPPAAPRNRSRVSPFLYKQYMALVCLCARHLGYRRLNLALGKRGGCPAISPIQLREKNRPIMPVAMVPARLLEYRALPAKLEAWLNLSQREKARELVMVSTRAMPRTSKHLLGYTSSKTTGLGEGFAGNIYFPSQRRAHSSTHPRAVTR